MNAEVRDQFIKQARECLKNRQYVEASEFAQQAVEIDPNSGDAYMLLGASLSNADVPDEAADALMAAIRINPTSAKARYNLAVHFYRNGWKNEAYETAKLALSLDDRHAPSRELLRQIEAERSSPEPQMFRPGAPLVPPSAVAATDPRIVPAWVSSDYYLPVSGSGEHRVALIHKAPIVWAIWVFALLAACVVFAFRRGHESWAPTAYALTYLFWLGSAIIEFLDQRPTAMLATLGALSALLVGSGVVEYSDFGFFLSQSKMSTILIPLGGVLFVACFAAQRLASASREPR